jgi:phytanoyl-CoA hydroxylase
MMSPIDAEMVARFHERGHMVMASLAPLAEIEVLRAVYEEILANIRHDPGAHYEETRVSPRFIWVRRPETVHDGLLRMDMFRNARAIAAQLLGLPDTAIEASFRVFHKPARLGGATPWHQDGVYKDPAVRQCIHAWVPLDPVSAENGHIHYISGSHREGLQLHRPEGEGDYNLTVLQADTDRAVMETVPLGGAAFHHFHTVHRAGTNQGEHARRVFTIVCETRPEPPMKRPDLV